MELVGTFFQSKMPEGQSLKLTAQFQPYNLKYSKENLTGKKMSPCKTETWFVFAGLQMQMFSGILEKKNFLEKNSREMQTTIIYHNEKKSVMVEVVLKTQDL